jgi:predicted lipoprotein with Yx(FWY)xxD motif
MSRSTTSSSLLDRRLLVLAAASLALAGCGSATAAGGGGSASGSGSASVTEVSTMHGSQGTYLTDSKGNSLYLFVKDKNGRSSCTGSCTSYWPPAMASGTSKAGAGVTASLLGTTRRPDGGSQLVYHGHPLYFYYQDGGKGDTNGQGKTTFGGEWWLVSPSGRAITGSGSGGSGSGGSGGSGGGGYSGGY